jgi:hypothetical protein
MMIYLPQIAITFIIAALFIGWLGLIIRRNRLVGPANPLYAKQWYLNIYRRGWKIIVRCPWVLWLPLTGVIIAMAEGKIVKFLLLKRNPELQAVYEQYKNETLGTQSEAFPEPLFVLLRNTLESAESLTDAVFTFLFRSHSFMALFLFSVMLILLKFRSPTGGSASKVSLRKRRFLGATSGIAGIMLLASYTLILFQVGSFQRPSFSLWAYFPVLIFYAFVSTLGYTTILFAMDAADRRESQSFPASVSEGVHNFGTLFPFFLFTAGIGFLIDLLPFHVMWILRADVSVLDYLRGVFIGAKLIFLITISFVPLLVVIQRAPLKTAFDACITLWAKEWKNLSLFIIIGSLLLLIPVMMESRVQETSNVVYIGLGGIIGWLLQIIKTALGSFLLASFVVFLKELQE